MDNKPKYKTISIAKSLAQKYGGKWTFDTSSKCSWRCDDQIQHVSKFSMGEESESSQMFLYYSDKRPTERVIFL